MTLPRTAAGLLGFQFRNSLIHLGKIQIQILKWFKLLWVLVTNYSLFSRAGSSCCPSKPHKRTKKKQLRAANSAEEISVEAATVLSELDDILILKEKQRTLSSVEKMFWLYSQLALEIVLLNTVAHRSSTTWQRQTSGVSPLARMTVKKKKTWLLRFEWSTECSLNLVRKLASCLHYCIYTIQK